MQGSFPRKPPMYSLPCERLATARSTNSKEAVRYLHLNSLDNLAFRATAPTAKQPDFKPGAFLPPAAIIDATPDLKEEIGNLRRKVAESEDAEAQPIDQYDLIVVDECHRGYRRFHYRFCASGGNRRPMVPHGDWLKQLCTPSWPTNHGPLPRSVG
jgi:hypothetical protein